MTTQIKTLRIKQHDNGTFYVTRDGQMTGDARPMTYEQAIEKVAKMDQTFDGEWQGSKWVDFKFVYQPTTASAAECAAMSKNDNS